MLTEINPFVELTTTEGGYTKRTVVLATSIGKVTSEGGNLGPKQEQEEKIAVQLDFPGGSIFIQVDQSLEEVKRQWQRGLISWFSLQRGDG